MSNSLILKSCTNDIHTKGFLVSKTPTDPFDFPRAEEIHDGLLQRIKKIIKVYSKVFNSKPVLSCILHSWYSWILYSYLKKKDEDLVLNSKMYHFYSLTLKSKPEFKKSQEHRVYQNVPVRKLPAKSSINDAPFTISLNSAYLNTANWPVSIAWNDRPFVIRNSVFDVDKNPEPWSIKILWRRQRSL